MHSPPRLCPVCGSGLAITRLTCGQCESEVSGAFHTCEFCALSEQERDMLRVFLQSRGNMRELERHLQVSYPTARARFDGLLQTLGLAGAPSPRARAEVLEQLARGEIDVEEAMRRIN